MKEQFDELAAVLDETRKQSHVIESIAQSILHAFKGKKKVIIFGNGGSYADALHFAAEFEGAYKNRKRAALPALVPGNGSSLTALGNDFGYENIFSKFVEAHAGPGDIVIGLTTSGRSPNVLLGLAKAREKQAITVGFTGKSGMSFPCDFLLAIPSDDTARIQEMHHFAYHEICGMVEKGLFG